MTTAEILKKAFEQFDGYKEKDRKIINTNGRSQYEIIMEIQKKIRGNNNKKC